MSHLRFALTATLIVTLLGVSMVVAAEENADACEQEDPPCGWTWGPISEERILFSIERTGETDPGGEYLRGFKAGFGTWDETESEFGGGAGTYWLAFKQGDNLKVYGMGVDAGLLIIPLGPVRVFPRLKVGLEYRADPPDSGPTGLVGMGVEFGVWLGRGLELAVIADRDFGFPSGTRNQVGFVLRIGIRPWWKPKTDPSESERLTTGSS